jgi:hypothetical protein
MIIRFIIYGVVICFLLYLIMQSQAKSDQSIKIEQIEDIEIDTLNTFKIESNLF